MPTLCGLQLTGCLPVSKCSTTSMSFPFVPLSFFILHALFWGAGWDLYCQWTLAPVPALYTRAFSVQWQQAGSPAPFHVEYSMYVMSHVFYMFSSHLDG